MARWMSEKRDRVLWRLKEHTLFKVEHANFLDTMALYTPHNTVEHNQFGVLLYLTVKCKVKTIPEIFMQFKLPF